jgi:hypothetical protein
MQHDIPSGATSAAGAQREVVVAVGAQQLDNGQDGPGVEDVPD